MRRDDDSWGEMDPFTPQLLEQVLAGETPEGREAARLAALVRELRQGLLEEVPDDLRERHVAAMVAAARASGGSRPAGRAVTRRRAAVLALAAALTLTGGLAWAGALPPRAQDVVAGVASRLGLELPSPSDRPEAADHGREVSEVARDPSLAGCEKGQAVAAVASEPSQAHRQDPPDRRDPCGAGDEGTRPNASAAAEVGAAPTRTPGPPQGVPAEPPPFAGADTPHAADRAPGS